METIKKNLSYSIGQYLFLSCRGEEKAMVVTHGEFGKFTI